jgi:predicted protein tyrosine phosphatase
LSKLNQILFICSANKDRSRTAEDLFAPLHTELKFDSAGTNEKICRQEDTQLVSAELIDWADAIYVMENKHRKALGGFTKEKYLHKTTVLGIQDHYKYNDSVLIELLKEKMSGHL